MANDKFACECGGETKQIDECHVWHSCRNKYTRQLAPRLQYERVQVNLKLTGGAIKYNWFVVYDTK